ncbi:Alpha/Beta hydrolase protein, partial [Cladochytrium replicatum]
IASVRQTMELGKDNVALARTVIQKIASPTPPVATKITKVYIPRRKDVLPDGMDPADAEGNVKAEWVDWQAFLSWKSDKVILYIHGGAFFLGSRKTHRTVTWRFARGSRCRVLSIDYRLSPEAVFPLGLQDCISAYLYLLDPPSGATHPRYPPENIVFMGDSAGGNLAIVLALWIRENGSKYNIPMPAGVCGISPWVDLTHSQPSFVLHGDIDYLPYASRDPKYIHKDRAHYYTNHNDELSNPLVSPLHAKIDDRDANKTELIPLPPVYVQTGTIERLHHENIAFAVDTLKNSPAPVILELYEDMPHVIPFFFFESIATLATRNACRFVRDAVG